MKKIIISFICVAMLALNGCSVADSDNTNPTEASTAKAEIGTSEYNILEEYSSYFNENKVSAEKVELKPSDIPFCQFFSEREITGSGLISTTIESVEEQYGLKYLRKSKDIVNGADFVYSIHPVKNGDSLWYLVFTYNMNGYVIDSFCSDKILSINDFLDIKKGESTFDDVYKIDNTVSIDSELNFTHHKCYKGYEVVVEYQQSGEDYIVSDIYTNADKVRITANMLMQDLELFN